MNLKEMTEHQLWQALEDAENEVVRLQIELATRLRDKHPILFDAVRDETRKVLAEPSTIRKLFKVSNWLGTKPYKQKQEG
jgi:hypothetical protein